MWVNNLPKVATQWNSGATRDSNRGRRVLIPSALTTIPPSQYLTVSHNALRSQNPNRNVFSSSLNRSKLMSICFRWVGKSCVTAGRHDRTDRSKPILKWRFEEAYSTLSARRDKKHAYTETNLNEWMNGIPASYYGMFVCISDLLPCNTRPVATRQIQLTYLLNDILNYNWLVYLLKELQSGRTELNWTELNCQFELGNGDDTYPFLGSIVCGCESPNASNACRSS